MRTIRLAPACLLLLAVACGGGGAPSGGLGNGGGGGGGGGSGVPTLSLQRVFPNLAFTHPVAMLQPPGDATRWLVLEQGGTLRSFVNDQAAPSSTLFADLTGHAGFTSGGETGLLGMAFHPAFPADPRVFLYYSAMQGGELVSRLSEFDGSGATLDLASERVLLTITKPRDSNNQIETNHNGGSLAFGPDGYLYIGVGDGGGGGDQHGASGNGQNQATLLGKILRIDVNAGGNGYGIPAGNPAAGNSPCGLGGSGTAACPEVWALGLRNPWRFSFDPGTGLLWVGDVGQDAWEEIDRLGSAGLNLGWRCREGAHVYDTACGSMGGFTEPVAEYAHPFGESITGGFVYRGTQYPTLRGYYVCADFINRLLLLLDAAVSGPTQEITSGTTVSEAISSFGQAGDGELYAVGYDSGYLWRVVAN